MQASVSRSNRFGSITHDATICPRDQAEDQEQFIRLSELPQSTETEAVIHHLSLKLAGRGSSVPSNIISQYLEFPFVCDVAAPIDASHEEPLAFFPGFLLAPALLFRKQVQTQC